VNKGSSALPARRDRVHPASKLTVYKDDFGWQVQYVTRVVQGFIWHLPLPGATTSVHGVPGPFSSWDAAMAYAETLRTYYGDQVRGDNLIFNQRHGRA
jgi:hypothetical protein